MNYKYKIGQKVRIKSPVKDLPMVSGPCPGNYCGLGLHMPSYEGMTAKIVGYKSGFYILDIDDDDKYLWSDGMLEATAPFSCRSLL